MTCDSFFLVRVKAKRSDSRLVLLVKIGEVELMGFNLEG